MVVHSVGLGLDEVLSYRWVLGDGADPLCPDMGRRGQHLPLREVFRNPATRTSQPGAAVNGGLKEYTR